MRKIKTLITPVVLGITFFFILCNGRQRKSNNCIVFIFTGCFINSSNRNMKILINTNFKKSKLQMKCKYNLLVSRLIPFVSSKIKKITTNRFILSETINRQNNLIGRRNKGWVAISTFEKNQNVQLSFLPRNQVPLALRGSINTHSLLLNSCNDDDSGALQLKLRTHDPMVTTSSCFSWLFLSSSTVIMNLQNIRDGF